MTSHSRTKLLTMAAVFLGSLAFLPSAQAESNGEMLYSTHCVSCHTTAIHWQDKKQATNWSSLQAQVRRWQYGIKLQWSESDILDVSRFLNDSFYHFAPVPDAIVSVEPLGQSWWPF